VLNDPAEYGATITGFGAHAAIDVTGFKFSGKPKVSFVEAASKKQGMLTLTDGSQSLKITLFGQYIAAGFHLAADGLGGTVVTYAAPAAHIDLAAGH
jgi:fibronectin-binding autotransporter adhesin